MITNLFSLIRGGGVGVQILASLLFFAVCATVFSAYRSLRGYDLEWVPLVGRAPGWFNGAAVKQDFIANGAKIIESGYRRYKNSMFLVYTADMPRIVLSAKYVDEIRTAPETVLSVREGMSDRHLGRYTTLDIILTSHLQNDVCKAQLTSNLNYLIAPMNEEACFWLARRISTGRPQVRLKGYETVLGVVAGITSRVLIGLPLNRNEEWLKVAVGYTSDVFHVSTSLRPYPPFLRPFVAPWLSSTKRLQKHVQTANKLLGHLFEKQLRESNSIKKRVDMIQWMVDSARGNDRKPDILVLKLLFLTLAAVHTSTMSATHALFDLCAFPEYIEPLRTEARHIISRHGWTLTAINEMKLLDSFMKESQRINHPGLLSFNRKVLQTLRLSDGTVLPAGTFITMATNSIARDPENYSDPDKFDDRRFYDMRKLSADDAKRHQFVSTGPDSLPFGHGKFACPGRFFAAAQIKVVLANILLRYDFSFPDGQTTRPPNVFSGEGIGPDREQTIVFSERKDWVE